MADLLIRTRVEVFYRGVNITRDVSPDLLSFTYTDNEGGKADDIELTLKNDHGRWHGPWLPVRGDKIRATIVQEGEGALPPLSCGTFTVDEIEIAGPPSTVTIKASSIPTESGIVRTKRSRAWESVRLSEIVSDVAKSGGLSSTYLIKDDPLYDRRDQRDETDLAFLQRMCDDEGFLLKCTDDHIVVLDPREYGRAEPVATISYNSGKVLKWSFTAQSHDAYKDATVDYLDPADGSLKTYTYDDPTSAGNKSKRVKKRAASLSEAERIAKAEVYKANRNEVTGSIEVIGDTRIASIATIAISGFGRFDGKYFVRSVTHKIADGYITTIDLTNTREPADKPTAVTTVRRSDGLEDILGE